MTTLTFTSIYVQAVYRRVMLSMILKFLLLSIGGYGGSSAGGGGGSGGGGGGGVYGGGQNYQRR